MLMKCILICHSASNKFSNRILWTWKLEYFLTSISFGNRNDIVVVRWKAKKAIGRPVDAPPSSVQYSVLLLLMAVEVVAYPLKTSQKQTITSTTTETHDIHKEYSSARAYAYASKQTNKNTGADHRTTPANLLTTYERTNSIWSEGNPPPGMQMYTRLLCGVDNSFCLQFYLLPPSLLTVEWYISINFYNG